MLDTFIEAVGRGEVKRNNMNAVKTKAIYTSRMKDLLVPPKAESKFPQINFKKLIYLRLKNRIRSVKQRDLLFSITHSIYRNRIRETLSAKQSRRQSLPQPAMQEGKPCPGCRTSVLHGLQGEGSLAVDKDEVDGLIKRPWTTP